MRSARDLVRALRGDQERLARGEHAGTVVPEHGVVAVCVLEQLGGDVTLAREVREEPQQPGVTRDAIGEAIDAGFQHIVLGLPAPYPVKIARWVADALITPWTREGGA